MIRDQRGAVYLEMLIGYLPVLAFFFGVLQFADVAAAHLIVQRAAGAAARAAVVVLPDDDVFYIGADRDVGPGDRKLADIQRAADLVLHTMNRLQGDVELDGPTTIVHGEDQVRAPVTATVHARYRCFARVFCGADGAVELSAQATLPYQGARYRYASE